MQKTLLTVLRHIAGALLLALPLVPPCLAADEAEPLPEGAPPPPPQPAEIFDSDGDTIPDADDPLPLVANVPVFWSLHKFSLARPSTNAPANSSWASSTTLDIASIPPAPKAQSAVTAFPLATRAPLAKSDLHPFALLAVFGSDTLRFDDLQRARVDAFLKGWREAGSADPVTLSFLVRFANLDKARWEFPDLEVPVVLDGRVWATARPKPSAEGKKGLLLPRGDQVGDREFTAEIEASEAEAFLRRLAASSFSPSFDFPSATGLDPKEEAPADGTPAEPADPNIYSLSAAFHSILSKTRRISVEGPGGRVWNWRVASVNLRTGEPVTFGLWAQGIMNDLSERVYGLPLFVLDGAYPVSVAGWDNGSWDLYWSTTLGGRPIDPSRAAESKLNADLLFSLVHDAPAKLPPEGNTAVLSHLRGVWFSRQKRRELARARECFESAGQRGAPQGYSWLGRLTSLTPDADGAAAGSNRTEAARLYRLAADADYAPGLAWYGRALMRGEGVKEDKAAGIAALRKAAEQGFPEGCALYALFLRKGVGVKADPAAAEKHLLEAAWQGSRDAMSALGAALLDAGSAEGRDWVALAAEKGDEKAAARLARFLRDGELGTSPDPAAAQKWLEAAAEMGDATSLVALGESVRAKGGSRSERRAADLFRRAADLGNDDGRTWYALCLLEGRGVRRDVPRALELLSLAADNGHINAQFFLGICRFGGFGGSERNPEEAMRRFSDAASKQPAANVFLGMGYLNGLGVAKNPNKAFACFNAAAEKGIPAAVLWVAHCHAKGIGVKKDLEEARKWAKRAEAAGIPAARQMLLSFED